MEQNKYEVEIGRKLELKRETYITTSYGEKYKIKDVFETLAFITPKRARKIGKIWRVN